MSITADVSMSVVSLTDDVDVGLKAGVSSLQTSICLKRLPADSESSFYVCEFLSYWHQRADERHDNPPPR